MFTNGLGADNRQAGSFTRRFETAIRRKAFLENREWVPSQLFQMVPIIWAKKSQGRVHHVADIILTNRIMAREAGYKSLLAYLKTRVWLMTKGRDGNLHLSYSKCVDHAQLTGKLEINTNGMVDKVYKFLESDGFKQIYSSKAAIEVMLKSSLLAKINNQAQDLHMAVIIVEWFFLPFVPDHKTDAEHWVMIIYRHCRGRKEFVFQCHNIFSLFPNKGNKELSKKLLTDHIDALCER